MIIETADVYTWVRIIRRCDLSTKGLAASTADHIALVLASFANTDGSRIFPGVNLISKCAKVAEKTVRRVLARLRELGLIKRVSEGSRHGRGYADEYRLTFPADLPSRVAMLDPEMVPRPVLPPVTVTGGPARDTAIEDVDNTGSDPGDNHVPDVPDAPHPGQTSGHLAGGQRSSDDQPHNHHSHTHKETSPPPHFGDVEGRPRALRAVEKHSRDVATDTPAGDAGLLTRHRPRSRAHGGRRAAPASSERRAGHRCPLRARPPPYAAPATPLPAPIPPPGGNPPCDACWPG